MLSVQELFWPILIGYRQNEAAAQNDWLLGGRALVML